MNLLEETTEYLKNCDKTPSDVRWVGSYNGEYGMTWDEFAAIANVEYDSGYGAQEIASDLVVVGDSWWLEREEYAGSESWVFETIPVQNRHPKKFSKVDGGMWSSIDDLSKKRNINE